ncbi:anthrone oxygenase family protein [Nocardia australiensis]|uniref:anthrone oxygenase family protein n=1 Tax=Nocardia australiensis TaxID=2887191 RepID=UPI001D146B71|nr:anthrone oxygenase family protein [Nocardia australiensis]
MTAFRIAALVAATLATGLIAGVFYAYANSVMPALNRTDDRAMVDVMQKINVVIINPWFMIGFLGTVGFTALAAALHLGKDHRTVLIWVAVALALNVIAFAVTSGLNVPLNDQLAAAGDPASIGDLAKIRADFESAWVRWNIVRAVLHTVAFLVLCGALFVAGMRHGRVAADAEVNSPSFARHGAAAVTAGGGPAVAGQPQRHYLTHYQTRHAPRGGQFPGQFGGPGYRRA